MHPVIRGTLGILVLIGLAWLMSSDRRRFPLKTVLGGIALQFLLALWVLQTDWGARFLETIGYGVAAIIDATRAGTAFVLANLAEPRPDAWGFVFAFIVIPPIIVFSALSSIGYHLGILQVVVGFMARIMVRLMGVSGAESLSAAGNVFLGQTEAPLLVRPYIARMTESELMAIMTGGFATIASGVMAAYVALIAGDDADRQAQVAKHFLTACLMSAPASLVMAKIMRPETGSPETMGSVRIAVPRETENVVHAAAVGAADGAKLAFNVVAMLIGFIALIALLDKVLIWFGGLEFMQSPMSALGFGELSLRNILGLVFWPIAWLIGADGREAGILGGLIGKAMATNEFIAYSELSGMVRSGVVSDRTVLLATYSLCGFANLSSIAIQIGGIGAMAPERKADLARLGLRAMLAGAMACWMTGIFAGMLAKGTT